jgi:hypothetical protein
VQDTSLVWRETANEDLCVAGHAANHQHASFAARAVHNLGGVSAAQVFFLEVCRAPTRACGSVGQEPVALSMK